MASTWKTVRVFISSTFRDMHAERDHLVKVVFPALRERLEKYRIHLIDIDLRWGVTQEQADNDQALDVCLDQIDTCRPFFIGILGERYGYVSNKLPERVASKYGWIRHHSGKSITELEILYGVLNNPEMRSHAFVCFRDPKFLRDVPGELLPVFAEFPTDDELRDLTPKAARACVLDRRRKLRLLKEVIRNAKLPTPAFENYPCQFAGLRINQRLARMTLSESDLRALEPVIADGIVTPDEFRALDERLRNIVSNMGTASLIGLQQFGQSIHDWLWHSIKAELKLEEKPTATAETDSLAEENDFHERFIESRLRVYVGREHVNDELSAFADGSDLIPCLVTGPSGSGKSAALARFVADYSSKHQQEIKDGRILVVPHFIGASPRSTNLRDMLRRFCQVLKARFGFAEDVPEEVAKLSVTFREFVGKVPADARVLLVIDALNQLDEADRAQELFWLPRELPPQVKVIVSCISDTLAATERAQREGQPTNSTLAPTGRGQGEGQLVLEAFGRRKHCPVELAALSDAEQRLIIRHVPSLSAKTLDEDQVRLLLSNPATANPLFLLVALEELRGFAPYERLNERIVAFPREGDTVTAIFTQVIERLEEEFDRKTAQAVLTLLASARRGLSERELQELLASSNPQSEIRNPKSEDLFPVLRQLRPYLLSRACLIDFYHRNLFKAVRERYLPSEEQQRQAHVRLADYFNAQEYWLESLEEQQRRAKTLPPTPRPANVRKVDELPWQLLQAADWQRSEQLLTDLTFLEAKVGARMVYDLVGEFSQAISVLPAQNPPYGIGPVGQMLRAIRHEIISLSAYPELAFQTLHNAMVNSADALGLGVRFRAEQMRHREPWLKLLTALPPTLLHHVRLAQDRSYYGCAFDPSGHLLIAGGPYNLCVWSALTGQRVAEIHSRADCLTVSPEGDRLAVGHWEGGVSIFTLPALELLAHASPYVGPVSSVAFNRDGTRVCSVHGAGHVMLWGAEARGENKLSPLWEFPFPLDDVQVAVFLPDNRIAAAAKKSIWLIDERLGNEDNPEAVKHRLEPSEGDVWSLDYADRKLATLDTAGVLSIWSCERKIQLLWRTAAHQGAGKHCCFSRNGKLIVSCGWKDTSVSVWQTSPDLAAGKRVYPIKRFAGHTQNPMSCAFSPDGQSVVSVSQDGSVRVWSLSEDVQQSEPMREYGLFMAFSLTRSNQLLALDREPAVLRLDARTGKFHQKWKGPSLEEGGKTATTDRIGPDARLALYRYKDSLLVWVVRSGRELLKIDTPYRTNHDFSPDGARVFVELDGLVAIDLLTGRELLRVPTAPCNVWDQLLVTPDGRCVLCGDSASLQQYFLPDGRHGLRFDRGVWVGRKAMYDPTGRMLAIAEVPLLDIIRASDGVPLRSLPVKAADAMCWSPNGRHLATSAGGRVEVWDIATGSRLVCYPIRGDCFSLGFSPQGTRLLLQETEWFGAELRRHLVRMQNVERFLPIVTAIRLFDPNRNAYDQEITLRCWFCDQRVMVPASVLDAIMAINRSVDPNLPPCFALPEETWDDRRLLSECPKCKRPIWFNPFVVDTR